MYISKDISNMEILRQGSGVFFCICSVPDSHRNSNFSNLAQNYSCHAVTSALYIFQDYRFSEQNLSTFKILPLKSINKDFIQFILTYDCYIFKNQNKEIKMQVTGNATNRQHRGFLQMHFARCAAE